MNRKRYLYGGHVSFYVPGHYFPSRSSTTHYGGSLADDVIDTVAPLVKEALMDVAKEGVGTLAHLGKAGLGYLKRKFTPASQDESPPTKSVHLDRPNNQLALPDDSTKPSFGGFEQY